MISSGQRPASADARATSLGVVSVAPSSPGVGIEIGGPPLHAAKSAVNAAIVSSTTSGEWNGKPPG